MTTEDADLTQRGYVGYYAYVPLVVWIAVILILGSGAASATQTSRILKPLIEFLFPTAPPETVAFLQGIFRKSAHFVEYAVLGFLALRSFLRSGSRLKTKAFLLALLIVALVAVIDETSQSLIESRTGSPWDVLLDIGGGSFALALAHIFLRRRANAEGG